MVILEAWAILRLALSRPETVKQPKSNPFFVVKDEVAASGALPDDAVTHCRCDVITTGSNGRAGRRWGRLREGGSKASNSKDQATVGVCV